MNKRILSFLAALLLLCWPAQAGWYYAGGTSAPPADQTLRPTADSVTYVTWSSTSGTRWAAVDEDTPDENTTYINKNDSAGGQKFTNLPSLPAGTILSVRVYFRAYANAGADHTLAGSLLVNGTNYNGTGQTMTGSYADYYTDWAVNPNTSAAWTEADVEGTGSNPLQEWGVFAGSMGAGDGLRATQVWLMVRYN